MKKSNLYLVIVIIGAGVFFLNTMRSNRIKKDTQVIAPEVQAKSKGSVPTEEKIVDQVKTGILPPVLDIKPEVSTAEESRNVRPSTEFPFDPIKKNMDKKKLAEYYCSNTDLGIFKFTDGRFKFWEFEEGIRNPKISVITKKSNDVSGSYTLGAATISTRFKDKSGNQTEDFKLVHVEFTGVIESFRDTDTNEYSISQCRK